MYYFSFFWSQKIYLFSYNFILIIKGRQRILHNVRDSQRHQPTFRQRRRRLSLQVRNDFRRQQSRFRRQPANASPISFGSESRSSSCFRPDPDAVGHPGEDWTRPVPRRNDSRKVVAQLHERISENVVLPPKSFGSKKSHNQTGEFEIGFDSPISFNSYCLFKVAYIFL